MSLFGLLWKTANAARLADHFGANSICFRWNAGELCRFGWDKSTICWPGWPALFEIIWAPMGPMAPTNGPQWALWAQWAPGKKKSMIDKWVRRALPQAFFCFLMCLHVLRKNDQKWPKLPNQIWPRTNYHLLAYVWNPRIAFVLLIILEQTSDFVAEAPKS